MNHQNRILPWALRSVAASALLLAALASAQAKPAKPPTASTAALSAAAPAPTDKDMAAAQQELIKLLRLSPTLTTVVSKDPSLLANREYVSHNNPQLAYFLDQHPEIARNPEFYLFTHMKQEDGTPDPALEHEGYSAVYHASELDQFMNNMSPVLAIGGFLVAVIWLVRVILENRRWGRIFKLQSEVHGKLIDKFGSNQELASYMETEAGKRFLEAAPIPVGFEPEQRVPNAVARVLTPLQIGIAA